MNLKKNILIATLMILPTSAYADTAYERALGISYNQSINNTYLNNNKHEIYPGVWTTEDRESRNSVKEVYPGVWQQSPKKEVSNVQDTNDINYNIVNRTTTSSNNNNSNIRDSSNSNNSSSSNNQRSSTTNSSTQYSSRQNGLNSTNRPFRSITDTTDSTGRNYDNTSIESLIDPNFN